MSVTSLPADKTAVVTGAGGPAGIGRSVAHTLAEQGWSLALIDINEQGLTAVESELHDAGHKKVLAVPTDISSPDSVDAAFSRIDEELPPVVGLVNLAGIACPIALHECSPQEFDRVMAVNVTGSYLMLKAAAARMIPQQAGRIVNTSSITAFDGGGTFSKGVYATAKAAVIGMSRGGARELGPYGITVNVIAPGPDRHRDHGRQAHRRAQDVDVRRHPPRPRRATRRDRRHRRVSALRRCGLSQRLHDPGRRRQAHALNRHGPAGACASPAIPIAHPAPHPVVDGKTRSRSSPEPGGRRCPPLPSNLTLAADSS